MYAASGGRPVRTTGPKRWSAVACDGSDQVASRLARLACADGASGEQLEFSTAASASALSQPRRESRMRVVVVGWQTTRRTSPSAVRPATYWVWVPTSKKPVRT